MENKKLMVGKLKGNALKDKKWASVKWCISHNH